MKAIIKLTTMGLLTLILSCVNVSGQEQSSAPVNGNGKGTRWYILSTAERDAETAGCKKTSFPKGIQSHYFADTERYSRETRE